MKRFECMPGYGEFVVRDNKNEVEFSIGDPIEDVFRLPDGVEDREPTREEIIVNIEDLSNNIIDVMYDNLKFNNVDKYSFTDFEGNELDPNAVDFADYTPTELQAMKNSIKEGLMSNCLPPLEKTFENRFECIPGYHEYLIVDNKQQVEISIGDPNELFDSLDGNITDGIDNYAEVVEDIAEKAEYENIDDLIVEFGSGDRNTFDFNEYTDEDKAQMKAAIKERLTADFLPIQKKSLSDVQKSIAEKKNSTDHSDTNTKHNGR